MKTHCLLLVALLVAASGCSRKEPPPPEELEETNTPPSSATTRRPGPGQIGGTEPGAQPLETLDTPEPRADGERMVPSPTTGTDLDTKDASATAEIPATEKSEGYFLSYRATHSDSTLADTYRFNPDNGELAHCRFNRDFDILTCTARFPNFPKPRNTREVSFSITRWRESLTSYVYPWRSFHPKYFRNTPDNKGTDFAMTFTYVLPNGQGPVLGKTRVYADRENPKGYANEECSEGRISVQVDRDQKTVRGEFSCVRMWTWPHADRTKPDENGPISIKGEFYLPYSQD